MCESVNELPWHYVLLVAVFNCLNMTAVMCCDWQAIECCLALTRRLSLQKNTSVWLESELQKWTEHSCLRFNIKQVVFYSLIVSWRKGAVPADQYVPIWTTLICLLVSGGNSLFWCIFFRSFNKNKMANNCKCLCNLLLVFKIWKCSGQQLSKLSKSMLSKLSVNYLNLTQKLSLFLHSWAKQTPVTCTLPVPSQLHFQSLPCQKGAESTAHATVSRATSLAQDLTLKQEITRITTEAEKKRRRWRWTWKG